MQAGTQAYYQLGVIQANWRGMTRSLQHNLAARSHISNLHNRGDDQAHLVPRPHTSVANHVPSPHDTDLYSPPVWVAPPEQPLHIDLETETDSVETPNVNQGEGQLLNAASFNQDTTLAPTSEVIEQEESQIVQPAQAYPVRLGRFEARITSHGVDLGSGAVERAHPLNGEPWSHDQGVRLLTGQRQSRWMDLGSAVCPLPTMATFMIDYRRMSFSTTRLVTSSVHWPIFNTQL